MVTASRPINKALKLAETQRGIVSRGQLAEVGIPDRSITYLLGTTRLIEIYPRVYRFGGSDLDWEDKVSGALVWGGPHAVASHRCAVRLNGLSISSDVVEITIPRNIRAPNGIKVHRGRIDPIDVRLLYGMRVMSVERALLTLGSVVPRTLLEKLMDEAIIKKKVRHKALVDVLLREGKRGVGGVAAFRSLLDQRLALPEAIRTELERRMHKIFREENLPPPVPQHEICTAGRRFVPDFAYPELKIAIEADGGEFHRLRHGQENDVDRQNLLLLAGWLVLRFTWYMVTRQPKMVASVILEAITSRTPL